MYFQKWMCQSKLSNEILWYIGFVYKNIYVLRSFILSLIFLLFLIDQIVILACYSLEYIFTNKNKFWIYTITKKLT